MDELFKAIRELTEQMYAELDYADEATLIQYIERRGILIQELRSKSSQEGFTKKYHDTSVRILKMDEEITRKLMFFKDLASSNIRRFAISKQQRSAYDVEYTADSYFYDKRK